MKVRAGFELLSIRTLRDEMAMSGQFQVAAGGQMQLASHTDDRTDPGASLRRMASVSDFGCTGL